MAKPYYRGHAEWKRRNPLRPGTPCPRCGLPMYTNQRIDVGHVYDAAKGGAWGPRRYEHMSCNRSAGGRLGAERKNKPYNRLENQSEEW